jgi:NTP pyrophosphatase (non-canonical NTP hydrolase)
MTKELTLNQYQDGAEKTAVYPTKHALEYLTLGLSSEVGELNGKVAKYYRKDGVYPRAEVLDELGDVLWFVSELARVHNTSLQVLAEKNLSKLADRQERGVLKGNGDNR